MATANLDFDLQKEQLARRRKIAEAMMLDSMKPAGGTEYAAGGMAVQRSPLEAIAQAVKGGVAGYQQGKVDADTKALGVKQREDVASAMSEFMKATTARPGQEEILAPPDAIGGGPGREAMPAFNPTAQGRQEAALALMGRVGNPADMAKLVASNALKTPEQFTLSPGQVRYDAAGNPMVTAPKEVKPPEAFTMSPGQVRYGPDGQPIVSAPAAAEKPLEIQRIIAARDALPPGDPQRKIYDDLIRKQTTHQPAATTNVAVNTDKQFLGNIGESLGKDVALAAQNARGAVSTINTVSRIREALDSGQVMAGPGTTPRVLLGQIGQVMGVTGDENARLLQTRTAIQGLAQLELDAAQQMKGQGQITESEREIIRRAASGSIDSMTVPELRTLTDTLDKTARFKIKANQTNVERLGKNPNAAPVVDFLKVDEPPPYAPKRRAGDKKGANPALDAALEKYR